MERGETARQTFRTRHGSVLAAVIGLLISLIAVSPARAQLTASPHAVYRTALDHIFVFAITSDGRLVDKLWNGQQWVWEDQGAPPGTSLQNFPPSAPSAVYQTKQDRVVVFATGRDGHLHAKIVDGQQCWLWEDAGSPPNAHPWQYGPPAAAYQPSLDRVSAFVTGEDGHLYSVFWDASQRKWVWTDHGIPSDIPSSAPGVFVATSPSVAHDASIDLVNAFVVGTDGKLYRNFWDQQGQRSVWSLEGIPSTGFNVISPILLIPHPSAAYETSQKSTFVFVITQDGHVWDKSTVWEDEGTPPGTIVNYPSPRLRQRSGRSIACQTRGPAAPLPAARVVQSGARTTSRHLRDGNLVAPYGSPDIDRSRHCLCHRQRRQFVQRVLRRHAAKVGMDRSRESPSSRSANSFRCVPLARGPSSCRRGRFPHRYWVSRRPALLRTSHGSRVLRRVRSSRHAVPTLVSRRIRMLWIGFVGR